MDFLGQLFMTGIKGLSLEDHEKKFIEEENIGGVILFSHNYESPAQVAELVNSIQKLRKEYPLFIAVDQEGGRVFRFKKVFTHFPPMFEIAKLDSPKIIFEVHQVLANELKAVGVNLNFSPVCDVWTNPDNKVIGDRAFGKKVEAVEKFVSAAIRGLHDANVLACAKHFPGHGDTLKDSHYDLPYIKKSIEEIESLEILPFIKAAKSRVEFIMMAHLIVDAIDTQLPTSLSPKAYEYLREKLKYDKIIVTDDMEMKAISDRFSYGDAATHALNAGADLLIYRSMETCQEAYLGAKNAIQNKNIKRTSIEEKYNRILKTKSTFLKNYKPIYIPEIEKVVGNQEAQVLLNSIKMKLGLIPTNIINS
jgi:beta-N-acetylhexosaminidase